MNEPAKLLDVVALLRETKSAEGKRLLRGQVGTIVEWWAEGVAEVEFSDRTGEAYAFASVPASDLMVLRHKLAVRGTNPH